MAAAPRNSKKAGKKVKRKLPKEIVGRLANLLAIDLARGKLSQKDQEKVFEGLGGLLTQVDATIPGQKCNCYLYGHYVGYILEFNCEVILGGTCE